MPTNDDVVVKESVVIDSDLDDNDSLDNEEDDFSDDGQVETPSNENEKEKEDASNEAKEDKPKQNKNINKFFKDQRLKEKALEEERTKAYHKGLVDAVGGINPYTNEKIEDEADIKEFLTMKEIEKKGLDPIKDYHRYVKDKEKETIRIKEKEIEQEKFIQNDVVEFEKKYPDVDRNKLFDDDNFLLFAGDSLGKVSLSSIYERYLKFTGTFVQKTKEEAEDKALKKFAIDKASGLGSVSSSGGQDTILSMDQIRKMSQSEVLENFELVEKSLAYHQKSKK
jgi:hypothetical protein